jgi:hypothetical protein
MISECLRFISVANSILVKVCFKNKLVHNQGEGLESIHTSKSKRRKNFVGSGCSHCVELVLQFKKEGWASFRRKFDKIL